MQVKGKSMKERKKQILALLMKKLAHSSSSMTVESLSHFLKLQLSCKG